MHNLHNTTQAAFHLCDKEVSDLLEAIKSRSKAQVDPKSDKRKHHRFTPFNHDAIAAFEHPGGSTDKCNALLLDISISGAGIAIRGFLHKGTSISITLFTNDGEEYIASGIVRWCDYFDKQVHMVGISLFDHIDPRNFASEAEWVSLSINDDDTAWMVERHALVIQDNPLEFNALQMLLLNANVKVSQANTIGAALDAVQEAPFDVLILYDSPYDKVEANHAVKELKDQGYTGPIIVLSNSAKTRKTPLVDAGAQIVIQRPIELPTLIAELRDIFGSEPDPLESTAPIYSTLSSEHCSESFFNEYISLINESIPRLELSINNDDPAAAIKVCLSLYSTGSSFGFPLLSSIAHQAVNSLNASCSPKESAVHIRKLIHIIRRLKAPEPNKLITKRRLFNKNT